MVRRHARLRIPRRRRSRHRRYPRALLRVAATWPAELARGRAGRLPRGTARPGVAGGRDPVDRPEQRDRAAHQAAAEWRSNRSRRLGRFGRAVRIRDRQMVQPVEGLWISGARRGFRRYIRPYGNAASRRRCRRRTRPATAGENRRGAQGPARGDGRRGRLNSIMLAKRLATALALTMLALPAACTSDGAAASIPKETAAKTIPLTIKSASGKHAFTVETAKTADEQERGLMYRTDLTADGGMLFAPYP